MNRAELIWMLNVSGVLPPCHGATENQFCAFERFAELVAASERQACAKVCEPQENWDDPLTACHIAAAIHARGQA